MRIHGLSHVGRVREENQDAFETAAEPAIALLADGMGGHHAGGIASHLAAETAMDYLTREPVAIDGRRLVEAAHFANRRVVEFAHARGPQNLVGTTLVLASFREVAKGMLATIANIGDSRAYLFTQGALRQITVDHTYVQALIEEGTMTPEQAKTDSNRHVLTRYIGDHNRPDIDWFEVELSSGDLVLLCSDGLTGMVEDETIAGHLSTEGDIEEKAGRLIEAALDVGGGDNVTVVLAEN